MLKKRFFKTKQECEVTFELDPEGARSVELFCEANAWQPISMKRTRKGPFRAKIRLPKEREYQFRYLVDGQAWVNDDAADAYCPNSFGSDNSVLNTTPPPRS
jgi:1,4-alpha-glucan branching enzyme